MMGKLIFTDTPKHQRSLQQK